MAYVTEDKRVIKIVALMASGKITRESAREWILDLSPQESSNFGYLAWEADEAVGALRN